ncbi:MAG: amino acid permease [Lachnospiraceae bacterium]|nr:amino acid permease [Lachnospiraceae bacterium]
MKNRQLLPYISPIGAWALSVGATIGWGLVVVLINNYLSVAGPVGSIIGLIIGFFVMLIISFNYYYLMKDSKESGGSYSYIKEYFDYDHGFLIAWFIMLTYLGMFWANLESIPYLLNFFFNNIFHFGFHYNIFGYEVYAVEIIFTLLLLQLIVVICICAKKALINSLIIMCLGIIVSVAICFFLCFVNREPQFSSIEPLFLENHNKFHQILKIAVITPWAYIGFENISHSSKEFTFDNKKTKTIMILSLLTSLLVYVLTIFLSISAYPSRYSNWYEYISDTHNLSGIEALPAFYASRYYLGNFGLLLIIIDISCLIITSLFANVITLSRLLYSMAYDKILHPKYYRLNKKRLPVNSILLVGIISSLIPFLGRSALGWIVDLTTISGTIIYGMVSGATLRKARINKDVKYKSLGIIGITITILLAIYLLFSNLVTKSALEPETYFLFAVWSILGFSFFFRILKKDTTKNFGKSTIVWIVLLILVFFTSLVWLSETTMNRTNKVLNQVTEYILSNKNADISSIQQFISAKITELRFDNLNIFAVFAILFGIWLNIHILMQNQQKKLETEKIRAEEENKAKSEFLFSMSHDIRTPMNAILGFSNLAKQSNLSIEEKNKYLEKIDIAGKHMLSLINDILDMSQIESHKLILMPEETNIIDLFNEIYDIFVEQMKDKNINFSIDYSTVNNEWIMCDKNRLLRVVQNLISNSLKFTAEGGFVKVSLKELGTIKNTVYYSISVVDNGIGMSEEFKENVFGVFERERSSTVSKIQGTGLGLSIVKNIVELMNGTIDLKSKQGEGTEFYIKISFPIIEKPILINTVNLNSDKEITKKRVLLVEDNIINQEIANEILTKEGYLVEFAEDGKIALKKVAESSPGYYDIILMDIQMPIMDGYEATKAIRSLNNKQLANIPIIAMSANSMSEDIKRSIDSGMNAHLSKPIDIKQLKITLEKIVFKLQ